MVGSERGWCIRDLEGIFLRICINKEEWVTVDICGFIGDRRVNYFGIGIKCKCERKFKYCKAVGKNEVAGGDKEWEWVINCVCKPCNMAIGSGEVLEAELPWLLYL